jgi:hypothetical protein
MFQKIIGIDRAIFQKRFWNLRDDLPEKNWNSPRKFPAKKSLTSA